MVINWFFCPLGGRRTSQKHNTDILWPYKVVECVSKQIHADMKHHKRSPRVSVSFCPTLKNIIFTKVVWLFSGLLCWITSDCTCVMTLCLLAVIADVLLTMLDYGKGCDESVQSNDRKPVLSASSWEKFDKIPVNKVWLQVENTVYVLPVHVIPVCIHDKSHKWNSKYIFEWFTLLILPKYMYQWYKLTLCFSFVNITYQRKTYYKQHGFML